MGHMEDRCWKRGKDGKVSFDANNYLKVLIDDEETMLEQLNRFCGTKHDFFQGPRLQGDVYLLEQLKMKLQMTKKQYLCS
jgi:hypothetical protein